MKITRIETIQIKEYPNVLWVEITTDDGIVGLGETFRNADAVAAYIHAAAAPRLIGQDPLAIDRHSKMLLSPILGFTGTGTEIRSASAIDIALWDIFGQAVEQPLYQLLGGLSRPRIPVYNTCAGYAYNNRTAERRSITGDVKPPSLGPYDDQIAFVHAADELAESLLAEGYTAMKIWPFDGFAQASGGLSISAGDLKQGLEPFAKIRRAVGDRIDIMCEFHSLWSLPAAKHIARALEDYQPFWSEDPIRMNDLRGLKEYKNSTKVRVCASETIATRWGYRDLFDHDATDFVMLDIGWCGGLSEAKKIATMAETHSLPIAPHDCTGPVVLAASVHLALNAPNTVYQEVVRAFLTGWYRELVTELPHIEGGFAYPNPAPGLGLHLNAEVRKRPDVVIRATTA